LPSNIPICVKTKDPKFKNKGTINTPFGLSHIFEFWILTFDLKRLIAL